MASSGGLVTVANAISSLENRDQNVDAEQLESAMAVVEGELDRTDSLNAKQKKAIKEDIAAALANSSNEQERQYLLYCLHWGIRQLMSQQQGKLTVSQASPFASAASLLPLPQSQGRKDLGLTQVRGEAGRDALSRYLLKDSSYANHANARYVGSVLTRSSSDGSPSPYIAYHTPNGGTTITGNYQEGWKDMVKLYRAAGVSTLDLGPSDVAGREFLANDTNAYQMLKTANDAGITTVLREKGVYESGRLLAEQGAKENPSTCEAESREYFNRAANDEKLGPRLREEMAKAGLGTKEELENMEKEALVEKCLQDRAPPKPEASPEAKSESSPEAQSESSPEAQSESSPKVQSKSPAQTAPKAEKMLNTAAGPRSVNTITQGNTTIEIEQEKSSGKMFVNGHEMPEEFTGQEVNAQMAGDQLWINDQFVTVSEKDGLTVNGRPVVNGQYADAEPTQDPGISPRR